MYFKDIIGQETVKQRLRLEVREGRVPMHSSSPVRKGREHCRLP